jgi:hypothetical protein
MKARLAEFFFHVDFSGCDISLEPIAEPGDFLAAEAFFGDVDGGSHDMGTYDIALGRGSVVVGAHEAFLVLDGANGRADDDGPVEGISVRACQIVKKLRRPGAAVAAIFRQVRVNDQRIGRGERNEQMLRDAIVEIVVIEDALHSLGFKTRILILENLEGAAQGGGHVEARNS